MFIEFIYLRTVSLLFKENKLEAAISELHLQHREQRRRRRFSAHDASENTSDSS